MKCLGGEYYSEKELQSFGFKRIGSNVKIHSRASIYDLENIEIGDNVRIDDFTVIIATGPLRIGSYVSIHNFCFLGSKWGLEIGSYVTFAPGVKIFTSSDDYHGHHLTGVTVPATMTGGDRGLVRIEDHVLIGAGSVILPNCTLSEGCSIGALSLVKSSLEPWGIYAGVPANRLKDRNRGLLQFAKTLNN